MIRPSSHRWGTCFPIPFKPQGLCFSGRTTLKKAVIAASQRRVGQCSLPQLVDLRAVSSGGVQDHKEKCFPPVPNFVCRFAPKLQLPIETPRPTSNRQLPPLPLNDHSGRRAEKNWDGPLRAWKNGLKIETFIKCVFPFPFRYQELACLLLLFALLERVFILIHSVFKFEFIQF